MKEQEIYKIIKKCVKDAQYALSSPEEVYVGGSHCIIILRGWGYSQGRDNDELDRVVSGSINARLIYHLQSALPTCYDFHICAMTDDDIVGTYLQRSGAILDNIHAMSVRCEKNLIDVIVTFTIKEVNDAPA
jgi:hypothetical protein